MAELIQFVADSLFLRQDLRRRNAGGGTVFDVRPTTLFQPFDSVGYSKRFLTPSQLGLSQSVSPKKIYKRSIVQSLNLHSFVKKPISVEVFQNFFAWQTLTRNYFQTQGILTFLQAVLVHKTRGVTSALALNQLVTVVIKYNRAVNDALDAQSAAIGYKLNRDIILQPIPSFVVPNHMTLTFGTLEIQLRRPSFSNLDRLQFNSINKRSRGNTLIHYRDKNWPKSERLTFDFEWLTQKQCQDAQYFFKRSLGKDISIVDFQGDSWIGFVTTPEISIVQNERVGFSFSMEFEGIET
jgi:hypothetical protein